MSDPADKSDDLIAELAKLMAASPAGNAPGVAPVGKPAPLDPAATSSPPPASPQPVRIPGMDQPRPPASSAPASASAPRAPVTGAIRIPGMDAPAPVSTSAPVSKFDFGSKPAAAPIKQEPLSTLSERLAPQNPVARKEPSVGAMPASPPSPVRIPSDLKPVSENRSFAEGPAVTVSRPAPAAPAVEPASAPPSQPAASKPASDFNFDFGFGRNPPPSASPPRPTPTEPSDADPIADLIAAELGDETESEADEAPAPSLARPVPASPVPVSRAAAPQPAQARPAMAQVTPAPQKPSGAQPIPLKPVSVAPRAPETDRFAISPGIGLNAKPPASQPLAPPVQRSPEPPTSRTADDSDPMSEIESLIGEAVRVELSPPGPVRVQAVPQVAPHVEVGGLDDDEDDDDDEDEHHDEPAAKAGPAPVVPPLGTQFAPRRAGLKDEGAASAEDAILAAAAATGASVDHIDPPVSEESPYRRLKVKPARSSWSAGGVRQYVGMAVAGTLLLAAGLGLYWVLNMGRGADTLATGADAPQLTADATPVKELPSAQASAAETETARSPVLQQIDGGASAEPSVEQLVSTDETAGEAVPRDVTQVAASDTEGGLANRKVRTVTVRPDGTIVSGDDAVAGAEALPVDRPNVPEVPTSGETTNLLDDTTSVAAIDTATAATTSTEPLTPDAGSVLDSGTASAFIDPTAVAPTPMQFPVRSVASAPARTETTTSQAQEPSPISLTGAQTPNGQIDLLGGTIEQPQAVASAAPVDSGNAAAYVQLSSSPSQADAQASLRTLTNRFGSLFGGRDLVIQSADLGQKGTWYRVKYPAGSLADAQSVCASIKANGGDCIVSGR